MKSIEIGIATLPACVEDARTGQVLLTHKGRPVAIIYGLQDFAAEEIQQCRDAEFWRLIELRRQQETITRAELEQSFE